MFILMILLPTGDKGHFVGFGGGAVTWKSCCFYFASWQRHEQHRIFWGVFLSVRGWIRTLFSCAWGSFTSHRSWVRCEPLAFHGVGWVHAHNTGSSTEASSPSWGTCSSWMPQCPSVSPLVGQAQGIYWEQTYSRSPQGLWGGGGMGASIFISSISKFPSKLSKEKERFQTNIYTGSQNCRWLLNIS